MIRLTRRNTLAFGSAGLLAGLAAHPASAEPASARDKLKSSATNPIPVHSYIYTIVTPTMEAGLKFYRDLMGYEVIREGKLDGRLPTVPGLGGSGRRYALLRANEMSTEQGILRLLEAPAGAAPNRPRPGASLLAPGLGGLECMTRNDEEAYLRLTRAGVETISPPLFYYQTGVEPMPGATVGWDFQDLEITTFVAYGPGGENIFISQGKTLGHKPWPAWTEPGLLGAPAGAVLVNLDRWAVFDFYGKAFGLKPSKDQYMSQDACNALIGAPMGTYFHFGGIGDGVGYEWWEYRDRKPTAVPPYPTDLNRTGLAMVTMIAADLGRVKEMVRANGLETLGQGALPTPGAAYQDGLYLRGPVGELLEVIGRQS